MPSYKRPGIYTSEFLTANTGESAGGGSDAIFIGGHYRGPTTEMAYLTSWGQFVSIYGGFPPAGTAATELPYAVYNFFSNGGRACWVQRIVGTGATAATVTLNDRAGSPLPTLVVTAKSVGTWGANLRVSIVDRDAPNGRFDLLVYEGGTTDAFLVERWLDVSMVTTDSRYVVNVINSKTSGSAYITVSNSNSATVAPNNTPAVAAGTALTGGNAGTAAGATEYTAAVTAGTSLMDRLEGSYILNLPGFSTAASVNAALTYAEGRGTFFVVIDPPAANDVATVVTYVGTLTKSSYGALYYPYIQVPDAVAAASGAVRNCPPGAFVCGKITETDVSRGVWKAPAGVSTTINNVVALERTLTATELDTLNESQINAIRVLPGVGTVVFGARTLKSLTADKYVNVRRTLNYIKANLSDLTQFAIFENNDHVLWTQLAGVTERFLGGMLAAGGLKGASADEAFYVKCDGELNTPAVVAAGEVKLEVGVALQRPAEFIVIRIGQWDGGQSTTEATA